MNVEMLTVLQELQRTWPTAMSVLSLEQLG